MTRWDDLHAFAVRHALAARGVRCSILAADGMAAVGGMSWSPSEGVGHIRDLDGEIVALGELDVLWWRRLSGEPRLPDTVREEAAQELIVSDCRATLLGLVLTEFRGRLVSHPEATLLAQNKLLQLRAAADIGLRVPRTLVSQVPEAVRQFCSELHYEVVVKTVAGTPKAPLMTGKVTPELVESDEAVAMSPAIYQELIPGRRHLRVCCFGEAVHTAVLGTDALDWRYPLDATVAPYDLDDTTAERLRQVIAALGLRMGIVDMKLTPDGEPVWLEVNPQGQFLFVEGLCGMPLTEAFADFLVDEAARGPAPPPACGPRSVLRELIQSDGTARQLRRPAGGPMRADDAHRDACRRIVSHSEPPPS